MDWIHCNSCFSQRDENDDGTSKNKFFLTECGHIFCQNCGCFADGTLDRCKLCSNKCSSTMIGEKLFRTNPQVLEYFQDPIETGEKLLKVMKFQKTHRLNLIKQNNRILSKYNKMKIYVKKLEHELKIVKNVSRNTSTNSYYDEETRSMISKPNFHSTPFKIMDTKVQNTTIAKPKSANIKHRKQLFKNESLESMGTSVHTTSSFMYLSPSQNSSDEKYINKLDKLQLDSFGLIGQFKGKDATS